MTVKQIHELLLEGARGREKEKLQKLNDTVELLLNPPPIVRKDYPRGYRIKDVAEQIHILRKFFPDIGYADENVASQPLPSGAEGWFALPRWRRIGIDYLEATKKVFSTIASLRSFDSAWNGGLNRQSGIERSLKLIGDKQKGHEILVVPAQFGLHRQGRDDRPPKNGYFQPREEFGPHESGLGVFEIGIMLLTHPERLVRWEDLPIDAEGDRIQTNYYSNIPYFWVTYDSHKLSLSATSDKCTSFCVHYGGSATFFI